MLEVVAPLGEVGEIFLFGVLVVVAKGDILEVLDELLRDVGALLLVLEYLDKVEGGVSFGVDPLDCWRYLLTMLDPVLREDERDTDALDADEYGL